MFVFKRDPIEFPSVPPSFDIPVSPMSIPMEKPNTNVSKGKASSSEFEPVNIIWKDPQDTMPSK